jgi:hypothetical protein
LNKLLILLSILFITQSAFCEKSQEPKKINTNRHLINAILYESEFQFEEAIKEYENGGTVCVDTNSDDSATSCIAAESDIRLKKNIKPIDNALEKIMKLEGVEFDWRYDEFEQIQRFSAKPHAIGLIAQEVEKVFPDALNEDIGEFKSVNYDALVPPLINAVKEQQNEIEQLKAENNALKKLVCLDHPEAEVCIK